MLQKIFAKFSLQNLGVRNYTAHMLGLEKMVAMRGGMQALSSNKPLHAALCLYVPLLRSTLITVSSNTIIDVMFSAQSFFVPDWRCYSREIPTHEPRRNSEPNTTMIFLIHRCSVMATFGSRQVIAASLRIPLIC